MNTPGKYKFDNITLVFQGVIYDNILLLRIIEHYKPLAKIVISTYFKDNMRFYYSLMKAYPDITIINNDITYFEELLIDSGNICIYEDSYRNSYTNNYFYQIKTTEAALNYVDTEYVIKSRVDFFFSNMEEFINETMENGSQQYPPGTQENYNSFLSRDLMMGKGKELEFPEGPGGGKGEPGVPPNGSKITCMSIFIRNYGFCITHGLKYHPSDICYGGKTETVKRVSEDEINEFRLDIISSEERKWRHYCNKKLAEKGLDEAAIFETDQRYADFMSSIFHVYPINKHDNDYSFRDITYFEDNVKPTVDYFIHGYGY